VHSIAYHEGYLYVTSTGTNEIYCVKVDGTSFGEQELFWQYPNVRYDRDEVHLNGLTVSGNRFIASCFGVRAPDESWSTAGRVFYIDSGHAIRDGLNQPHSPLVVDGQLFFAESAAKKVFVYTKTAPDTWNFRAEILMPGYTRGLALQAGKLLVGISSSRKVSRSRKTAVGDRREPTDTALMRVDLKTHSTEVACGLNAFAREVYDIVPVNNPPWLGSPFDALSHRVREMESTIDEYMVKVQSLVSQLEEAHRLTAPVHLGRKVLDYLIQQFRNPPHTSNSGLSAPATTAPRDNTESRHSDDRSA
jgi:hypothetical protein